MNKKKRGRPKKTKKQKTATKNKSKIRKYGGTNLKRSNIDDSLLLTGDLDKVIIVKTKKEYSDLNRILAILRNPEIKQFTITK